MYHLGSDVAACIHHEVVRAAVLLVVMLYGGVCVARAVFPALFSAVNLKPRKYMISLPVKWLSAVKRTN